MKLFLVAFAALLLSACTPKEEDNNGNNGNNGTQSNNGVADMGDDDGTPDLGMDMEEEIRDISCHTILVSPRSIPAADGGSVAVEFECSGVTTPTEVEQPYTLTFPNGDVKSGTVSLELEASLERPRLSTTIVIPASVFMAGEVVGEFADIESDKQGLTWSTSAFILRVRQRPDLLMAEWDDLIDEAVGQIRDNPLAGRQWVRDFQGNDAPGIISAWREGTKLRIEHRSSDGAGGFMPIAVEDVELGVDAAETAGAEDFLLVRDMGTSDDTSLTVFWYGLDADGSLHVASVQMANGMIGASRLFTSTTKSAAILDVDVIQGGAADGESPGLFLLGTSMGSVAFQGLTADPVSGAIAEVTIPNLGGDITPELEEGGHVNVQLMRGWTQSTADHEAIALSSLYISTVGKTGPAGEHEIRRIVLAGGEVGQTERSATFAGVDPQENGFVVDVKDVDGDLNNDIVLTSVLDSREPVIRVWKTASNGALSAEKTVSGAGSGVMFNVVLDRDEAERAKIRFGKRLDRVIYSGGEYPFLQTMGAKLQHSSTQFIAGMGTMNVNGNPVAVEIAWSFEGALSEIAYIAPISIGTKAEVKDFMSGSAVAVSGNPSGGLNLSVRNEFDAVLVASHSNGQKILMDAALYAAAETPVFNTDNNISVPPQMTRGGISLFDDISSSTLYVVTNAGAPGDTLGMFKVWQIDSNENEGIGPALIEFPKLSGTEYELLTAADDMMRFATTGGDEYRGFALDLVMLAEATKNKSTITLDGGDIKVYGGAAVGGAPKALRTRKRRKGGRVRPESAQKRTLMWTVDQGFNSALPVLALMGVDDGDACPYQLVVMPTDPASSPAVSIGEGSSADCWDLPAVFAVGDVCGVGGEQFVTGAVADPTAEDVWSWELQLVFSSGAQSMATALGSVEVPAEIVPEVSVTDINGDGFADIAIFVPAASTPLDTPEGELVWLFSDGTGGALNSKAEPIPGLSDVVRSLPGAGPGLPGGQYGCGQGILCAFGKGTRNTTSPTSARPELL